MPQSAPSACPFCGQRACSVHTSKDERLSAALRGYDGTWQRLRAMKLASQPLCELYCMEQERLTVATEVHHVRPIRTNPELRLVWENLRSTCHPCHMRAEHAQ